MEENTNTDIKKRMDNKEYILKESTPENLDNQMAKNKGQRMCVCKDSVDRDEDDNENSIRNPENVYLKFTARLKRPTM
jgi:hypothetical protein